MFNRNLCCFHYHKIVRSIEPTGTDGKTLTKLFSFSKNAVNQYLLGCIAIKRHGKLFVCLYAELLLYRGASSMPVLLVLLMTTTIHCDQIQLLQWSAF